jgi:nucleosome binding factor SPN SPT16 subunit
MADQRNGSGQPSNAARNVYAIDVEKFKTRLKAFYSNWNENKADLWGSSDVVAIATPPPSEDLRYLKSSALNIWLLGYEFPETVMVFMKKQIHFLCSQKKASLLEVVKKPAREVVGVDVVMHVKAKTDNGTGLMEAIFRAIRSQSGADGQVAPVVGHIVREAPEGNLLETWSEKLKGAGFELADVTNGLSDLFAVKDADELINVKKAAFLTFSVMNNIVVPKLENVIDEEKNITHSALMDEAEKAILDPTRAKAKLKADNVDICYPPIFQSGGEFDLRPSAASNDEPLYYDSASVIIIAVGSRYNSYCSNVARTLMIDATPLQSKAYAVLLKAHEAAIGALKPGNKLSAAYQAALSVVEKEAPELVPNLSKSAGTGMGLEFRESGLNLNAKNDRAVKAKMVLNVSLGFQNLQNQTDNPKIRNFSLLLADTVIVGNLIILCNFFLIFTLLYFSITYQFLWQRGMHVFSFIHLNFFFLMLSYELSYLHQTGIIII